MSNHYGICALCRKECELTYEHIPPRAAFNSQPVKFYSAEKILLNGDRLPWDFKGLKYDNLQKGSGKYSICQECNNNTGAWYGEAYRSIAYTFVDVLNKNQNKQMRGVCIKEVYGMRFIKQILSMFCSVNDYYTMAGYFNPNKPENRSGHSALFNTLIDAQNALHEAVYLMEDIRSFVLDKNAVGLDKNKFKLCMYETNSELIKLNAVLSQLNLSKNKITAVSEITVPPLGFLLYFNPQENLEYKGVDITMLADYGYDEKMNIEIPLQVLEMNTYLPMDYRTKEQIQKDAKLIKR